MRSPSKASVKTASCQSRSSDHLARADSSGFQRDTFRVVERKWPVHAELNQAGRLEVPGSNLGARLKALLRQGFFL